MKAIFFKELREQLKWALLGMLAVGVALAVTLRARVSPLGLSFPEDALVDEGFLTCLGLGSAALGLLLGFLAIFSESSPDRRSLLLHRPLQRSRIFFAKALAGLTLLGLAVGLPFALAAWVVSNVGTLEPPFRSERLRPGLGLILAGVPYYFAGVLTAARPARWYGSRALGIIAAIVASILVAALPFFSWAVVGVLSVSVVLAIAAWGSFLTAGEFGPQPWGAKVALGGAFAVAIGLTWTTLCVLLQFSFVFSTPTHSVERWERWEVGRDGMAVKVVTFSNPTSMQILDLSGEPVEKYLEFEHPRDLPEGTFIGLTSLLPLPGVVYESPIYDYHYWRDTGVLDLGGRAYYEPDEALIHAPTGVVFARVEPGFVGPNDEKPRSTKPTERFRGELLSNLGTNSKWRDSGLLPFSDAVYRFRKRLEKVFEAPAGDPIVAVKLLKQGGYAILTQTALHVLAWDYTPLFSRPFPSLAAGWGGVRVGRLGDLDAHAVWWSACGAHRRVDETQPQRVEIVSDRGEVLATRELPASPPVARPTGNWAGQWAGVHAATTTLALTFFSWASNLSWASKEGLLRVVQIVAAFLSALVVAALTVDRALPKRSACIWTGAAFLLGPIGILTFLALEERAARETCSGCGKPRIVSQPTCRHCQAGWPEPTRDGTEIFEPAV